MSTAEPTDPEQVKADMRKCPRWILVKFQTERQEKLRAEQAVASAKEEVEQVIGEINDYKKKVEELERKKVQLEDIDQSMKRLMEVLDEKDLLLQQTDKLLLQKTEEAEKYRNFIKEVQEIKMKADHQVQEFLRSKDSELRQKEELIQKLTSDAARFKNFIRNAHKSIIFRPDTMQTLFKEQQQQQLLFQSSSPLPSSPSSSSSNRGSQIGIGISSGSGSGIGSIVSANNSSCTPRQLSNRERSESMLVVDQESLIPFKEVSDLVLKDEVLKQNIFRKWFLQGPDYHLVINFIDAVEKQKDVPADKIAQAVVNFFEVSGPNDTLGLFKQLIVKEVLAAGEDEMTIFRSNSCRVKVMRAYLRLVGVEYLRTTLAPFIAEVSSRTEALEVDPTKVNPSTQEADITSNLEKLKELVEKLIHKICNSVEAIPLQLRVLFSYLSLELKNATFKNANNFVGGFVFLRFISPAIAAPESFDFLSGTGVTINDNYKRTCILVSKLLQNIANGVSFKEQYLQSLNQWASEMNKQILHFVGELLDIPADAATDTNNFAPTTIATSMAHCIADLQKYMCDLREQLCGYYQSNTERFVEGMSFTTSRLLSVILGAGLLAAQSSSEPPFLKSYSKILLTSEKLLPAVCKQAMKRKGASLDSLASALVHFFAFHNSAPVMLKSLIQAEIYCTDYVFVDSFASKVFTYYCQFFSQNVLKKHLEPHLQNILHNNIAIEIEEDRMTAAEKHKKTWNIQALLEQARLFLAEFMKLLPTCPFPIWDICNYLASGDFGNSQDICEFLFFSWFCPVVEEPERFGLLSEIPKPGLRRTFSLLSDVLRKVAKANVFYTKDTSFKQLNEWIEGQADQINTFITDWAREPSDGMLLTSQSPEASPSVDETTRDKALSTIHHFMMTKATFFSHVLTDDRFYQGVSYTLQELCEGLFAKPIPIPTEKPITLPESPSTRSLAGSSSLLPTSLGSSGSGLQIGGGSDIAGRERKREKSVRALTKITSQLKKGVGNFIEESSNLFETPRESSGPNTPNTPPFLGRMKDSVIVGSLSKLQELDDPELAKARDRLYETLTSFYTNETEEDKRKRMRQEVIGELISTETSYIKSLSGIKQYVMEPLKTNGIITPDELKDLFSNLTDLIPVNQKLLRNLQGVEDLPANEQNLGEIFYLTIPELKVYKRFCVEMVKSIRVREKLAKRPTFGNFINEATRHPDFPADCRNLDNLLIQPMQRICRYPLLLGELYKRTPDEFEDKSSIARALEAVANVAQEINESKATEERASGIIDVAQRFLSSGDKKVTEESLMTDTRVYVNEIVCKKIKLGNTYSGKGVLFLFDDLLLIAQLNKQKVTHLAQFPINPSLRTETSPKTKNTIEVVSSGQTVLVTMHSDEERDNWLSLLAQAQAGKFALSAQPSG